VTHEQQSPVATTLHETSGPILRRSCGCGGSCGSCQDEKKTLQRSPNGSPSSSRAGRSFTGVRATRAVNMRVGPADDAFEREADRVADAVVGGGHAAFASSHAPSQMQRAVDGEGGESEDEGEDVA